MPFTPLSPAEFIERAKTDKLMLTDEYTAWLQSVACEWGEAKRQYYLVYLKDKTDERVPFLRSEMETLEAQFKGLEHTVSSLQSTLKAERELNMEYNRDR